MPYRLYSTTNNKLAITVPHLRIRNFPPIYYLQKSWLSWLPRPLGGPATATRHCQAGPPPALAAVLPAAGRLVLDHRQGCLRGLVPLALLWLKQLIKLLKYVNNSNL